MRKQLSLLALAFATAQAVIAGGLNTNTNQNASFLRLLSQGGLIDITSLYVNPAGTAFLAPGHHLSLSMQNAKQSRTIATTFPLFALNQKAPGVTTHDFKGDAYAPIIPSFQYSYNTDGKWSFNAQFALVGGGGKCEFDNGLGSFEAQYAGTIYSSVAENVASQLAQGYAAKAIPQYMAAGMSLEQAQAAVAGPAKEYAMNNLDDTMKQVYQGYDLNAYMKGKQYYFGFTLGATYKLLDNLSISAGLRGVYAMCNYNGFVQDVKYTVNGQTASVDSNLSLNADQTGFGVAPVLGFDWKINDKWNIAFKHDFKTRIRLENKSEMNVVATAMANDKDNPLSQFKDGAKIAGDIASLTTIGVQYSPIESLRILAGYNLYGDKKATAYGAKEKFIDKNTYEINAGIEYDLCKYLTLSCGWQTTQYGLSDAYMNDLSFNTSSNNYGVGFRYNATEKFFVDFGFMYTDYDKREVICKDVTGKPNGKIDLYHRTNRVLGISATFKL